MFGLTPQVKYECHLFVFPDRKADTLWARFKRLVASHSHDHLEGQQFDPALKWSSLRIKNHRHVHMFEGQHFLTLI